MSRFVLMKCEDLASRHQYRVMALLSGIQTWKLVRSQAQLTVY